MASTGSKLGCAAGTIAAVVVLAMVTISIGRSVVSAGPAASASAAPAADFVKQAPADLIALLDGLRPGDLVGDYMVYRMSVDPAKHQARIEFMHDKTGYSLYIEKKTQAPAPRQTVKYSIFYSNAWADGAAKVPDGYQDAALSAIANRISKTEDAAPVPGGL